MRRLAPLLAATAAVSCNWLSLAKNALSYETVQRGEAANLASLDTLIYATLAEDGLAIVGAASGARLATFPPPAGSESIDDLAIADGLLFALDARPPGHISVYTLANPLAPRPVTPPHDVPVGPFSGVAAAGGVAIVSGGTSQLTAWHYDSSGTFHGPVATADLGRGQPDVLLSHDGTLAFVATHTFGPYFGLTILRADTTGALETLATLELDGAGFTRGGAKPANFPIEAAALGPDTVLVAYARGIGVISTASPREPKVVGLIDVGGPAVNVDVQNRTAAVSVAGPAPAIVLLDFSTPRERRIVLPPGTFPAGVALTALSSAVAARDRGVLVFNR